MGSTTLESLMWSCLFLYSNDEPAWFLDSKQLLRFSTFPLDICKKHQKCNKKRFVLKCFLEDVDGITSIYSSYVTWNTNS